MYIMCGEGNKITIIFDSPTHLLEIRKDVCNKEHIKVNKFLRSNGPILPIIQKLKADITKNELDGLLERSDFATNQRGD